VSVSLALTTAQTTGGAGTDTVTLFENLTGSAYGDTLTGSTAANLLVGLAGDDSLNGGDGADTMVGGTGNDSYVVDNPGDVVMENPGEGADTVSASVTYVLGANVEDLTLTGTGAINGTGNGDANLIIGNAGNNVLAGLGGADTLSGGAGADRFVFLNVTDSPTGSGDVIMDFSHAQSDKIDLSGIDANSTLAGDQAFTFIGAVGFHGIAGELNYSVTQTGITVTGDVNGDGVADFAINLTGLTSIASADFIL
jgi:Ca2+-binding RTX toxin-like protein